MRGVPLPTCSAQMLFALWSGRHYLLSILSKYACCSIVSLHRLHEQSGFFATLRNTTVVPSSASSQIAQGSGSGSPNSTIPVSKHLHSVCHGWLCCTICITCLGLVSVIHGQGCRDLGLLPSVDGTGQSPSHATVKRQSCLIFARLASVVSGSECRSR